MKRPEISDFFPESTTIADIHKLFTDYPELYRYVQALDGYVDWLIDMPNDGAINERARQVDLIRKSVIFNTEDGDLTIHESKFLKNDEIGVIDWSKVTSRVLDPIPKENLTIRMEADNSKNELLFTPVFEVVKDWEDSLIWCPSQCYKLIQYKGVKYEIYLRWRHCDPWTAEIYECDDNGKSLSFKKDGGWNYLDIKNWLRSDQLIELKQDAEAAASQWLIENDKNSVA